jgi:hypothetical protein
MSGDPSDAETDALNELTAQLSQFNWKDGVVDKAKRLLYSSNVSENIQGVMSLKAMLCIGREEVYEVAQEVIDAGVICRLVEFLSVENRDLQCPAAFCLTNVAAGLDSQTERVVQAGAIDPLIGFLSHSDSQLRRQAVFCLANIAGSTPEYRILLAEHPHFFEGLFFVARTTQDLKIVELVCWNLRNICLFGGPTFQVLRPGVMFLLNDIIKNYWNHKDKSVCVGFALETLCTVCQQPDAMNCLLEAGLFDSIMSVLSRFTMNASSINESSLKCLTCILLSDVSNYRQLVLMHHGTILNILLNHAVIGHSGPVAQEASLKCFMSIASEKNLRLPLLQQHENLFVIIGQILVSTSVEMTEARDASHTFQHMKTVSKPSRLCSCYIFASCITVAPSLPKLLLKLMDSIDAVNLLLSSLEFMAQLKSADLESGPSPLLGFYDPTVAVILEALSGLFHQGKLLQQSEKLSDNPIQRFLMTSNAVNRLTYLLQFLPRETHSSITLILNELATNSY